MASALNAHLCTAFALTAISCAGASATGAAGGSAMETAASEPMVGVLQRDAIESARPAWREARERATPDPSASRALASVPPGAQVTVYLGTWCGDSRREVTRLWRALDLVRGEGGPDAGTAAPLPFALAYVGVDRGKHAPGGLVDGVGLRYVPTLVVRRDGREVGRIVESSPHGVERDLLELLTGARTGVISSRLDLSPPR